MAGSFLFSGVIIMRYHHEIPENFTTMYGQIYKCDHPVYNQCTLITIGDKGLAIIQQRFLPETKSTYWSEIDPWLVDELYLHPDFAKYFEQMSSYPEYGLYSTVTIRQIMWALKMKPLKRERWETVFDRKLI